MWKWSFIASMCITMVTLVVSLLDKLNELQKLKNGNEIKRLEGENNILKQENENIKELKDHNCIVLLNKNSELNSFREEVENIVTGKRTPEEKIDKIKELLFRNNNSKI